MRSRSSDSSPASGDRRSDPVPALPRRDDVAMGESCAESCCDDPNGEGARAGDRPVKGAGLVGEPGLGAPGVEGMQSEWEIWEKENSPEGLCGELALPEDRK